MSEDVLVALGAAGGVAGVDLLQVVNQVLPGGAKGAAPAAEAHLVLQRHMEPGVGFTVRLEKATTKTKYHKNTK